MLLYQKIDEILDQDPKRKLSANRILLKLETLLCCSDLSNLKQSIKSDDNFQISRDIDLTVISDTADREKR